MLPQCDVRSDWSPKPLKPLCNQPCSLARSFAVLLACFISLHETRRSDTEPEFWIPRS